MAGSEVLDAPQLDSVSAPASTRATLYTATLLTTINFFNYVDRMVVVTMYDDLRRVFHLSNGQLGALSTAFYLVHALATVPFGWASDRFDRRHVMALAVLTWSAATLGSAYAVGFLSLLALRSAVGIGEAASAALVLGYVSEIPWIGMRGAFALPAFATLLAGVLAYRASCFVRADMEAKQARQARSI